jgi:hypothetical protein
MANKWLAHVKKTMKIMKRKGTYKKGLGLSQVIKEAKKHWHKKGGADKDKPEIIDADVAPPMEGGEGSDEEKKEEMPPTTESTTAGRRRRGGRTKKAKRSGRK